MLSSRRGTPHVYREHMVEGMQGTIKRRSYLIPLGFRQAEDCVQSAAEFERPTVRASSHFIQEVGRPRNVQAHNSGLWHSPPLVMCCWR